MTERMTVVDELDADEALDADKYVDMGLTAKLLHDKRNGGDEPNRHVVVTGGTAVVLEVVE